MTVSMRVMSAGDGYKYLLRTVAAGDVNGDGVVDDLDAALVYGHINGKLTLTDEQLLRADVNGDGLVEQNDAAQIYAAYLTDTGR